MPLPEDERATLAQIQRAGFDRIATSLEETEAVLRKALLPQEDGPPEAVRRLAMVEEYTLGLGDNMASVRDDLLQIVRDGEVPT